MRFQQDAAVGIVLNRISADMFYVGVAESRRSSAETRPRAQCRRYHSLYLQSNTQRLSLQCVLKLVCNPL